MSQTRPAALDVEPVDTGPRGRAWGSRLRRLMPSSMRVVGALVLAAVLLQLVVTVLFAWPAGSAMRHVPIAVAGPPALTEPAGRSLEASSKGALSVTRLATLEEAADAVTSRRVYGAVVIEDAGLRLLLASAASPEIGAQLLQAVERIQARAEGTQLLVEDLAPNPARDPTGKVPAAAILALLITSAGVGVLVLVRLTEPRERAVALVGVAVGGAAVVAAVLHHLLGALNGSIVAEAGVLALLILATAGAVTAFGVVADLPGAGLASLVVVALGYPISGATSAPEMIPSPWDTVGAFLPAGAGNTALRDVAFFSGAGARTSLVVLGAWSLLAVLVVFAPALEGFLSRRTDPGSQPTVTAAEDPVQVVKKPTAKQAAKREAATRPMAKKAAAKQASAAVATADDVDDTPDADDTADSDDKLDTPGIDDTPDPASRSTAGDD